MCHFALWRLQHTPAVSSLFPSSKSQSFGITLPKLLWKATPKRRSSVRIGHPEEANRATGKSKKKSNPSSSSWTWKQINAGTSVQIWSEHLPFQNLCGVKRYRCNVWKWWMETWRQWFNTSNQNVSSFLTFRLLKSLGWELLRTSRSKKPGQMA